MTSDRDDTPAPTTPANGTSRPANGATTAFAAPSTPPPPPFQRTAVKWGKQPVTVFRTGPLPKGDPWPTLPPGARPRDEAATPPQRPPAPAPSAGFFSGSMIPQARPIESQGPLPTQRQSQIQGQPQAPARMDSVPLVAEPSDLSMPEPPRADPSTVAPEPAPPIPPVAQAIEVPPPPPAPSSTDTLAARAEAARRAQATPPAPRPEPAAASPFALSPDPVVSDPVAPATIPASRPRTASRLPLFVALGVIAVLAVGTTAWFLMSRGAETDASTPTPVPAIPTMTVPATGTLEPIEAQPSPPLSTTPSSPEVVTDTPRPPASTTAPTQEPSQVRPVPSPPQGQNQTPALPSVVPPPLPLPAPDPAPPVVIVAPPPTAATPPPSDPDAPIVTRPQPLD